MCLSLFPSVSLRCLLQMQMVEKTTTLLKRKKQCEEKVSNFSGMLDAHLLDELLACSGVFACLRSGRSVLLVRYQIAW